MRIMGEITCRLNADAIKPGILYCTEPKAYRYEEWTSTAAWATAVFTLLLAIFAWLAWRNSVATLENLQDQMERQDVANKLALETARINNEVAIKAARDLAKSTRQDEFLTKYSVSLLDLVEATVVGKELTTYKNACTISWMNWGMELLRTDSQFRELIGRWNTLIAEECDAYAEIAKDGIPQIDMTPYKVHLTTKIGTLIGSLQTWQVDPSKTEEMRAEFLKIDLQGSVLLVP